MVGNQQRTVTESELDAKILRVREENRKLEEQQSVRLLNLPPLHRIERRDTYRFRLVKIRLKSS